MQIRIGKYKNTKFGLIDSGKKITILNFPWPLDYSNLDFLVNRTGINNGYKKIELAKDDWFKGTLGYSKLDSAPVAVLVTATGNVTAGTHVYRATYVSDGGEESIINITNSNVITNVAGTSQQTNITTPAGPSNTASRKIYRSLAGTTTPLYLVGSINDNVAATVFNDNVADATILANNITPPTISNNYDFDYSVIGSIIPPVSINDGILCICDIPNQYKSNALVISDLSVGGPVYELEIKNLEHFNKMEFQCEWSGLTGVLDGVIEVLQRNDSTLTYNLIDSVEMTKILNAASGFEFFNNQIWLSSDIKLRLTKNGITGGNFKSSIYFKI
jgi:hypothetical protein